jgi:hypothetical protein
VNVGKTQEIGIGNKLTTVGNLANNILTINEDICLQKELVYLGVIINSRAKCSSEIKKVKKQFFPAIHTKFLRGIYMQSYIMILTTQYSPLL